MPGCTISIRASMNGTSTWVGEHGLLRSMKGWLLHIPMVDLMAHGYGIHFTLFNYVVKHADGIHVLVERSSQGAVLGKVGEPTFHKLVELCWGASVLVPVSQAWRLWVAWMSLHLLFPHTMPTTLGKQFKLTFRTFPRCKNCSVVLGNVV